MTLTIKKKKVADDYIITGNKTESYLKFYKNIKNRETAAAAASRLFVIRKLLVGPGVQFRFSDEKQIQKRPPC